VSQVAARGRAGISIGLDLNLHEAIDFERPRVADSTGLPILDEAVTWPLELEV